MDREYGKVTIKDSEIHKLIGDLDFPIIYTTNYDNCIENTYDHFGKQYLKISNVIDLLKVNDSKRQIVKFHGDFSDDKSIVLSESTYFERLEFENPLDLKLRSDSLGKSILFVGYSLKDPNVRFLLFKLQRIWRSSFHSEESPTSYLFSARSNPVQETVLKNNYGVTVISSNEIDIKTATEKFLESLI